MLNQNDGRSPVANDTDQVDQIVYLLFRHARCRLIEKEKGIGFTALVSALEDALGRPFAGVYGTKMIPGNQPDVAGRFKALVDALKFVYATTFFHEARAAGIEPQQHQLLLAIKGLPDDRMPTIGTLAERLQLQHHSAVELVDRSVQRNLVRRVRGTSDQRQVFRRSAVPGVAHSTHRVIVSREVPFLQVRKDPSTSSKPTSQRSDVRSVSRLGEGDAVRLAAGNVHLFDEQGRRVFDGLVPHVAGAGRGSFNHRFAQPSRDAQPYTTFFYPTDVFPFTSVEEADPVVPSVSGVWRSALWAERECFDLMGIRFAGHPDLRRILMYAGFAVMLVFATLQRSSIKSSRPPMDTRGRLVILVGPRGRPTRG